MRLEDGRAYILTNAHVASSKQDTVLRVQKHGNANKFNGQAICIGYDCDLALIHVDSDAFWEDLPTVQLARELPELYETVQVIGYPAGGQSICITKGVISRVSLQHYTPEAPAGHLVIQIDAAIKCVNPTDCAIAAVERSLKVATVQAILAARLLATRVTWLASLSSRVLEATLTMWVGLSLFLLCTRFWHNSCNTKIITG